jgi:serine O-acetyltransferase
VSASAAFKPPPHPLRSLADVRRYLAADLAEFRKYSAGFMTPSQSVVRQISILLTPPMLGTIAYRVSHWLYCRGHRRSARLLGGLNYIVHKCAISPACSIGPGLYMPHTVGLVFHGHAGARLTLYHRAIVCAGSVHAWKDEVYADCPVLGSDVTVGVNSVVMGGVTLGDRAFVAALATVTEDVPPDTIVVDRNVKTIKAPRPAEAGDAQASAR